MKKRKGHLYTGIIGTKYLWPVLVNSGNANVARTILRQTTYPGYGYWISKGATTLWEQWDAENSHNHQMFGTVTEFLYKYLVGIRSPMDEGTAEGYNHILISPYIPDDMKYVKASLKTIHGKIVSHWEQTGSNISMHVEIPANTDATICIPVKEMKNISVTEGDVPIWNDNTFIPGISGIADAENEDGCIKISVLSGSYDFVLSGQ
jgi:alpha-L-rhamnosidase